MINYRNPRPRPRDEKRFIEPTPAQQTQIPITSPVFIASIVALIVFVGGSMLQINPTINFVCALVIVVFGIYEHYHSRDGKR